MNEELKREAIALREALRMETAAEQKPALANARLETLSPWREKILAELEAGKAVKMAEALKLASGTDYAAELTEAGLVETLLEAGPSRLQRLLDKAISEGLDDQDGKSGFALAECYGGGIATFLNNWAGPSGRFLTGRTTLIGAASEGGKTTIGNVFALSALSAGLPVLYWQAELAEHRHLEDLVRTQEGMNYWEYLPEGKTVPPGWDRLLEYPPPYDGDQDPLDLNTMLDHVYDFAGRSRAKVGEANACPGLVILDYVQLMEHPAARTEPKVAEAVAKRLASAGASTGLSILIMSQATKGGQDDLAKAAGNPEKFARAVNGYAKTCFSGADIRRSADLAFVAIEQEGRRFLIRSKARGNHWQDGKGRMSNLEAQRRHGTIEFTRTETGTLEAGQGTLAELFTDANQAEAKKTEQKKKTGPKKPKNLF